MTLRGAKHNQKKMGQKFGEGLQVSGRAQRQAARKKRLAQALLIGLLTTWDLGASGAGEDKNLVLIWAWAATFTPAHVFGNLKVKRA